MEIEAYKKRKVEFDDNKRKLKSAKIKLRNRNKEHVVIRYRIKNYWGKLRLVRPRKASWRKELLISRLDSRAGVRNINAQQNKRRTRWINKTSR